MQNHYRDELADFHNVCDEAGVPTGNTGLRVRWLVEQLSKRKDAAMTNEQIQKRAEALSWVASRWEQRDRIAAALREARDEAIEACAKVAESRIPTLKANGGSPAIRGHAIRINSIDIAAAIRKLKGSGHEG